MLRAGTVGGGGIMGDGETHATSGADEGGRGTVSRGCKCRMVEEIEDGEEQSHGHPLSCTRSGILTNGPRTAKRWSCSMQT